MKMEINLTKEEWSEIDHSAVWLYSRLEKGEIPKTPKYIKRVYDKMIKLKEETKDKEFDFIEIQIPERFKNEKELQKCYQNFLSIASDVFGNSNNRIAGKSGEEIKFIINLKG